MKSLIVSQYNTQKHLDKLRLADPILVDLIIYVENAKTQIFLMENQIKTLHKYLKTGKDPKKDKGIESHPLKLVKLYMTLYKQSVGVGLYINNWPNAVTAMSKVIAAFEEEGQTPDIQNFLQWAVQQRTHTGEYVPIGYLSALIQEYRVKHKKVESNVEFDETIVQKLLAKRRSA